MMDKLDDLRIVLVRPSHPGNIGSAARALKNMGLAELVLLCPDQFPSEQADALASGARDVLESAHVVNTLEQAVAGCQWVVGTTARRRGYNDRPLTPRAMAREAVAMHLGQRVALLFGRERTGLTNAEVDACHALVEIPANPDYSSLNLAQAVQVVSYELRQAALALQAQPVDGHEYPEAAVLENFYAYLEQLLLASGFLNPENPRHLMRRLRTLFGRARLDNKELSILRGIFATLEEPKHRRIGRKQAPAAQRRDEPAEHSSGALQ